MLEAITTTVIVKVHKKVPPIHVQNSTYKSVPKYMHTPGLTCPMQPAPHPLQKFVLYLYFGTRRYCRLLSVSGVSACDGVVDVLVQGLGASRWSRASLRRNCMILKNDSLSAKVEEDVMHTGRREKEIRETEWSSWRNLRRPTLGKVHALWLDVPTGQCTD